MGGQEKGRVGASKEGQDCQVLARGLSNVSFHALTEHMSCPRVMYVQS